MSELFYKQLRQHEDEERNSGKWNEQWFQGYIFWPFFVQNEKRKNLKEDLKKERKWFRANHCPRYAILYHSRSSISVLWFIPKNLLLRMTWSVDIVCLLVNTTHTEFRTPRLSKYPRKFPVLHLLWKEWISSNYGKQGHTPAIRMTVIRWKTAKKNFSVYSPNNWRISTLWFSPKAENCGAKCIKGDDLFS